MKIKLLTLSLLGLLFAPAMAQTPTVLLDGPCTRYVAELASAQTDLQSAIKSHQQRLAQQARLRIETANAAVAHWRLAHNVGPDYVLSADKKSFVKP
jgi:hypothetical protein